MASYRLHFSCVLLLSRCGMWRTCGHPSPPSGLTRPSTDWQCPQPTWLPSLTTTATSGFTTWLAAGWPASQEATDRWDTHYKLPQHWTHDMTLRHVPSVCCDACSSTSQVTCHLCLAVHIMKRYGGERKDKTKLMYFTASCLLCSPCKTTATNISTSKLNTLW